MRRVLLDESLPRQLVGVLADLEVVTVLQAGWAGRTNGELLELAQDQFDVLLTGDKHLRFQQNRLAKGSNTQGEGDSCADRVGHGSTSDN